MDRKFKGNPYYDPKTCGLELLFSEDVGGSYEFNIFVLWKDKKTGTIYCGTDSGCSCPTPFEDVHTLSELTYCPNSDVAKAEFDSWGGGNGLSDHRKIERFFPEANI